MLDRSELLKKYWKKRQERLESDPDFLQRCQKRLGFAYEDGAMSSVIGSTESIAVESIEHSLMKYHQRQTDPWLMIRPQLSCLYWMNELEIFRWVSDGFSYEGDTSILERCFFHSMMLQAKANDVADWIAPFMLNVFRAGGWFHQDKEFGHFYNLLLEAQLKDQWIPESALNKRLAPELETLLRTLPQVDQLPRALVDYCDWRLARAHRYPDFLTPKKQKATVSGTSVYVFERGWWGIFPFELFAIQAIYRRCTGQEISLEAEHPLLQTPLMHPPALLPLMETPETLRLKEFISQTFGSPWQPLKPVALV
jgi:hypothetical protein